MAKKSDNWLGTTKNNSVFNNYTVTPANIAQYNAFRGVTDFTQVGQFDQYETGYQFLEVLGVPAFMDQDIWSGCPLNKKLLKSFVHMLEYEFRGMDGLPDIQSDSMEITDGINSIRMINRVSMDTSIEVSMQYFEKRGSLIEKISEYYLTGIKDPKTQAKTYHGAIAEGALAPSFVNEVFTMMYFVTDNTMLRLERAVLLCNCQLTRADFSMYNGSRDSINNRETTISFNCFPVTGAFVDKAAAMLLGDIQGVVYDHSSSTKMKTYSGEGAVTAKHNTDSWNYDYAITSSKNYKKYAKNPNDLKAESMVPGMMTGKNILKLQNESYLGESSGDSEDEE